jgi:kynureninase
MNSASLDVVPDLPALRAAYSRFLLPGRILLTGHSHQAWPDVAREALIRSFDDAAELVDNKWEAVVFPKVRAVGASILERMGFDPGDPIAFGKSTHELVFRLLTCLRLQDRPRIVTTTAEFHSLYRQLTRLAEEGVEVCWVDAEPRAGLADRILAELRPGTAMLALSAVLFEDAYVVPRLGEILERAVEVGAIPLVDAYHAFNVVPLDYGPKQAHVFVTSGGYKYAEFGEGLSWLRIPEGTALRPVDTGWFADFGSLFSGRSGAVSYGPGGARFLGATFDPSAVYRAEAALAHMARFELTPARLRAISLRQTARIFAGFEERGRLDAVLTPREDERRGGFVTVRDPAAGAITQRLRERGVFVDSRRDLLRVGPAPYLTDEEIDRGVLAVIDALSPRGG